jgi:hypothetical protein
MLTPARRTCPLPAAGVLLLALGLLAGCATGGPNHVYLTTAGGPAVQDLGPPPAQVDKAVKPGECVLGLAYDFNTDHVFLRIAPAQVIRVIERPSGKILREMPLLAELRTPAAGNGASAVPADLAIRSSDRHLFAVTPDGRIVIELTLFGKFVRGIEPAGLAGPIGGLACDQRQPALLVLAGNTVQRCSFAGQSLGSVELKGALQPVSLGYDSDARHYFVPLADGATLGEFDAAGSLVATHPAPGPITAVDAGPRAFVRVF